MANSRVTRRCFVAGHVQGVFFRASTAHRARALGLVGHALNLEDGRVEVLAIGPREGVDALCEWLRVGPPAARVEHVDTIEEATPEPPPAGFSTR